jgi:hypothetical protein
MTHAAGFIDRQLKDALGSRGKFWLTRAGAGAGAGEPIHQFLDTALIQSQFAEDATRNSTFFTDQTEQQMLSPNVIVLKTLCFFLRQAEYPSCALGEAFHLVCHAV